MDLTGEHKKGQKKIINLSTFSYIYDMKLWEVDFMNNIGQFLLENWLSLIFGLISIAIVAYCKSLHKKFKEYKIILDQ